MAAVGLDVALPVRALSCGGGDLLCLLEGDEAVLGAPVKQYRARDLIALIERVWDRGAVVANGDRGIRVCGGVDNRSHRV